MLTPLDRELPQIRAVGTVVPSQLWTIIAIGMLLRLVWAAFVPVEPVSDSAAYDTFARMLVMHGVYGWAPDNPGAYWPVGTSAIVAATYLLLGDTYVGVVILNLLAGLAIMFFVFRLGEIYFGPQVALYATAMIAFWPNLIMFTTILSSELFFVALLLGGLYFWERRSGAAWLNILLCGVIWAAACYVRPVILLLPVALAISGLRFGLPGFVAAAGKAAATILIIVILVSPWTYRNYQVFGEPVFVSTNFGPTLWMGNNPDSKGGWMHLPEWARGVSEVERARRTGDAAKAYIRENPIEFVRHTLVKAVKLHDRETMGIHWNLASLERYMGDGGLLALKLLSTGYWYMVLGAGLLGVVLLVRGAGFAGLFHPTMAVWGYFTALHAVTVIQDRYHMPSAPAIAILAGVTVAHLTVWISTRREAALKPSRL